MARRVVVPHKIKSCRGRVWKAAPHTLTPRVILSDSEGSVTPVLLRDVGDGRTDSSACGLRMTKKKSLRMT